MHIFLNTIITSATVEYNLYMIITSTTVEYKLYMIISSATVEYKLYIIITSATVEYTLFISITSAIVEYKLYIIRLLQQQLNTHCTCQGTVCSPVPPIPEDRTQCYIMVLRPVVLRDKPFAQGVGNAIRPYEDLLTSVKRSKLKWYGHVTRSSGLAKTVLQGTVQGWRRRGRQRKRWEDNIKEWTGLEWNMLLQKAENREEWRKLVVKSTVVPQRQPDHGTDKIRRRQGVSLISLASNDFIPALLTRVEQMCQMMPLSSTLTLAHSPNRGGKLTLLV